MTPVRSRVDRPQLVFALSCAAYLLTWAGHMDSGDSSFRIAWAKAMLFHGTARIDSAGLGALYCKYSIGHSLLAMPFLGLSAVVQHLTHVRVEGPVYMLLFVLNAAAFLTLAARYLRLRFSSTQTFRALLLLAFCTVWLPCSRMDSIEQLVLTFLFAGFLAVKLGKPLVGMAIASYAITIRPDAVVLVAILACWHLWPLRKQMPWRLAVSMAAVCVPALSVNAAANWIRWGTLREAGYPGETFSAPLMVGLYGMLFSAGKSIFLYSPPLFLGVAAVVRYARTGKGHRDYWFFAAVLLSQILLYAKWWDWSGDDSWGVRFLNPGVMLMCLPAAEFLGGYRWPRLALAVAIPGLFVQSLAVLVDPLASDYVLRHFHMARAAIGAHTGSRVDLEDVRFNPRYSPIAANWLMLRLLVGTAPPLQHDSLEIQRTGTPLYNSLLEAGWDPRGVECDLFWVRLLHRGVAK